MAMLADRCVLIAELGFLRPAPMTRLGLIVAITDQRPIELADRLTGRPEKPAARVPGHAVLSQLGHQDDATHLQRRLRGLDLRGLSMKRVDSRQWQRARDARGNHLSVRRGDWWHHEPPELTQDDNQDNQDWQSDMATLVAMSDISKRTAEPAPRLTSNRTGGQPHDRQLSCFSTGLKGGKGPGRFSGGGLLWRARGHRGTNESSNPG